MADFPDSPLAERQRFLTARKGDAHAAAKMLQRHLEWRAASLPLPATAPIFGRELPEWIVPLHECKDGTKLLLALPATCDLALGSASEYAAAAASLLDAIMPRESMDRITILIDVDGVPGGACHTPLRLLPLIRELVVVLAGNFPERVERILVYPVPFALRWVWSTVQGFIDPVTASKVKLFAKPMVAGLRFPAALTEYADTTPLSPPAAPRFAFPARFPNGDRPLYGFTGWETATRLGRLADAANDGMAPAAIPPPPELSSPSLSPLPPPSLPQPPPPSLPTPPLPPQLPPRSGCALRARARLRCEVASTSRVRVMIEWAREQEPTVQAEGLNPEGPEASAPEVVIDLSGWPTMNG